MKKAILIAAILFACGVGVAAGIAWGQGERGDLRKDAEAARADAAGLRVAVEEKRRALERRAAEIVALTEQIDAVETVAGETTTTEVIKWRTDTIEVPVERLIPGATEYVEGNCVIPSLPPVVFDAVGSEARLLSDAGNLFAVGSVELWRRSPPPDTLLGSAPWRADLTELTRQQQRRPPWRLSVSAFASTRADVGIGLNWQSRRRWGLQAGYLNGSAEECAAVAPYYEAYSCNSSRRGAVYAGVTYQVWPFRRK